MAHLIIEGFIGSGKGAVGRAVAKKLKIQMTDLDKLVAERMKMNTAEIYERLGEPYYRAMETLVLHDLLEQKKRTVIVLGSGAAILPQNKALFEQLGRVYYIKLKPKTLLDNMKASDNNHNWIRGDHWDENVQKLFREREPFYKKTADVTVDAEKKTPEELADLIIADARANSRARTKPKADEPAEAAAKAVEKAEATAEKAGQAADKAAKKTPAKAAGEKAEKKTAAKAAGEKAEKKTAAKASGEKAEKKTAAKASGEKAEKKTAAKAAGEKAEKKTAAKAAGEKAEKKTAAKASGEKAEKKTASKTKKNG